MWWGEREEGGGALREPSVDIVNSLSLFLLNLNVGDTVPVQVFRHLPPGGGCKKDACHRLVAEPR